MGKKLNVLALGYAAAVLSALCMLVLGIFGNLGIYEGAVRAMMDWHLYFSLSVGGIVGGMIEGAIWSFIAAVVFAWLYNSFAEKK
jgi:hypothetical protein